MTDKIHTMTTPQSDEPGFFAKKHKEDAENEIADIIRNALIAAIAEAVQPHVDKIKELESVIEEKDTKIKELEFKLAKYKS